MSQSRDVAAIILAAGQGSRFGREPKLLASFGGSPMVRDVVKAAASSSAEPVIVVTGDRAEEIEASLQGLPIQVTRNGFFADGLSTSLKMGFAALPLRTRAAVVLLGDMPLISPTLIDTLIDRWRGRGEPAALIPTLNGRRGNPVVLSRELETLIEGLSGDAGAGPILRGRSDVVEFPVPDSASLLDVDTTEELGCIAYREGQPHQRH
jgi:molybdenum cofactor cytidylyltransferase